MTFEELWLEPIPLELRESAVAALGRGDVMEFLMRADNEDGLELVSRNYTFLRDSGLYESALLEAWTSCRTNWSRYRLFDLMWLFAVADRQKLREAGSPIPKQISFVAYRGVAGKGKRRRVSGLSWTESAETAQWFAARYEWLADPAVYQVRFRNENIVAYLNTRDEQEYILRTDGLRPRRLRVH